MGTETRDGCQHPVLFVNRQSSIPHVGDESGVVVIPRADAAAVLAEARALAAGEVEKQREFTEGKFIPEGLDALLRQRGCEMVD